MPNNSPVFYLAFSNGMGGQLSHLRNLKFEANLVRMALNDMRQDELCEIETDPEATPQSIFDTFQGQLFRDRIAVFHYGGHADSQEIFVEDGKGGNTALYSEGLSGFLGQQKSLKLMFINGCASQGQADSLLKAGVPVVIATSRKIGDEEAVLFARTFYQGISSGATIGRAFKEAESSILATKPDTNAMRGFYWDSVDESAAQMQFPWKLFYLNEVDLEWKIALGENTFGTTPILNIQTDMIGKTVGNHILTDYLNAGNFGYVFKAKHAVTGDLAAIKISYRVLKGYEDLKDVIVTGSKGLSALNHPNIAKVSDVGELQLSPTDRRFYTVMELVTGNRLDKIDLGVKNANREELKAVLKYGIQILEGLKSAHETVYESAEGFRIMGVLHGNIKSRKVIINEQNVPKLIDFLFANLARISKIEVETPEEYLKSLQEQNPKDYDAPEHIQTGIINLKTDIYSAGAVLFEVFTGKKLSEAHPITGPSQILRLLKAYNPASPSWLSQVLYKALAPDPQDRYNAVREMIETILANQSWWIRLLYRLGIKKF